MVDRGFRLLPTYSAGDKIRKEIKGEKKPIDSSSWIKGRRSKERTRKEEVHVLLK